MMSALIETALRSANDTRRILIGTGVLEQTGQVFTDLFGPARAVVVADGNTDAAAGGQVRAALSRAGVPQEQPFGFPGTPTLYAGYDNVARLRDYVAGTDAIPVVVGAGTLNDIAKVASAELGREYLAVATAASMDGYTAYGASITADGFKQNFTCPAPAGVIAEVPLLAAAPERLTATGYGDLIEKVPAGADWILADALGIEAIDDDVWNLVQGPLRTSIGDPGALVRRERRSVQQLTEGLIMSGLAMQAYQTSRPASGAGHQFSHLWEMEHLGMNDEPPLSHGFKVGLGTIAIAALYEQVLARDLSSLDVEAIVAAHPTPEQVEEQVRAALSGPVVDPSVAHSLAKHPTGAELRRRLLLVRQVWPDLRAALSDQLLPAGRLQDMLTEVGAVSHPAQVGLGLDHFRATYARARMIRPRYTVLDLLADTGLLEACVAELFTPQGFWGAQAW